MTGSLTVWRKLTAALSDFQEAADAKAEAAEILFALTGKSPAALLMNDPLAEETFASQLEEILAQRKNGRPLAYILGKKWFYGYPFFVSEGVLIPRSDTEILVDAALEFLAQSPAILIADSAVQVWDLCAGSGCVGLSIAQKAEMTFVHLLEKEEAAFSILQKNVRQFGSDRVQAHLADLCDAPLPEKGSVRLITANPPYILSDVCKGLQKEVQAEPITALDGGADGLDLYPVILSRWGEVLCPGGGLFLEIGYDQGAQVADLFRAHGFLDVRVLQDFGGRDRVVCGVRP